MNNIYKISNKNKLNKINSMDYYKERRELKGKFYKYMENKLALNCQHLNYINSNNIRKINRNKTKHRMLHEKDEINNKMNELTKILSNFKEKEKEEILDDPIYFFNDYPYIYKKLNNLSISKKNKISEEVKKVIKPISNVKYSSLCISLSKIKRKKSTWYEQSNMSNKFLKNTSIKLEKNNNNYNELIDYNNNNKNIFKIIKSNRSERVRDSLIKFKEFENLTKSNKKKLKFKIHMNSIFKDIKKKIFVKS